MALAAIAGLEAEARILRRVGIATEASGADPARAAAIVERLLAAGARALLSFGIAGGLAPGLAPGTILLPRRVVTEAGETFSADETLRQNIARRLAAMGFVVEERDLLGCDAIAATTEEKARLFHRIGAVAVDLESLAAARAAARAHVAFAALRAVADPAEFDLPPAALVGLGRDGRAAPLPVLGALARAPAQLPALIRLALLTRAALRSLSRSAPALSQSTS
jgi:adenosylhomocysteine nucleosidase